MENRSKNFDFFTEQNKPNARKKQIWKKIWFWIKIVLYLLVFAFSMTGCIQSFVLKSSNYTGSGMEFYQSKKEVSPKVVTFKGIDKDGKTTNDPLKITKYVIDPYANVFIKYKQYPELLKKLHEQNNKNNNALTEYGSSAVAVGFQDENENNNNLVYSKDDKFLFFAGRVGVGGKNSKWTIDNINNETYDSLYTIEPNIAWFSYNDYTKGSNAISYLEALPFTKVDKEKPIAETKWKIKKAHFLSADFLEYDKDLNDYKKVEAKSTSIGGGTRKLTKLPGAILETDPKYLNNKGLAARAKFSKDIFIILYNKTFNNNLYKERIHKAVTENNTIFTNPVNTYDMNKFLIELNNAITNNEEIVLTYEAKSLIDDYQRIMYEYVNNLKVVPTVNDKHQYDYTSGESKVLVPLDGYVPLNGENIPHKPIYDAKGYWKLGPFYGFFVWPLSALTLAIRTPMSNLNGWATIITIVLIIIITRSLSLSITWKTLFSQSRMEDIKAKKAKIDAKYAEYDQTNKMMKARKQQEIMDLYKKNNINPFDMFLTSIVSMPIFLAIWRVIQCLPDIKSTTWLGMDFAATSYSELFSGNWIYLFIIVFAVGLQALAQFLPRMLSAKKFKERTTIQDQAALKKSNRTQNWVSIIFIGITILFSAGVQVYWILGAFWTIGQVLVVHALKKTVWYREKFLTKNKIV